MCSVKSVAATWNYKSGGIVHYKSPTFIFLLKSYGMVAILASINGKLHLKLYSMLCALSQNYEHVLENYYETPEENRLRNSKIKILVCQKVHELLMKTIISLF